MKPNLLRLLISLFLPVQIWALNPSHPASAYQHLCEVNRHWLAQAPFPDAQLADEVTFSDETARIRHHLQQVEIRLRNRPAQGYSTEQRRRRLHHLAILQQYWQQAEFPVNRYHPTRQPYFRDHTGRLCAVGHLLWADGQQALVERSRPGARAGSCRRMPGRRGCMFGRFRTGRVLLQGSGWLRVEAQMKTRWRVNFHLSSVFRINSPFWSFLNQGEVRLKFSRPMKAGIS